MSLTTAEVERLFTYQPPSGNQPDRYKAINEKAKDLVLAIVENCPPSDDTEAAVRKVREARMTANAAIALED